MTAVVLRPPPSVRAAYRHGIGRISVSDQAVSDTLDGVELGVSAALVRHSAARIAPVPRALHPRDPSWVRGYRVRIPDGNALSATERRVRELHAARLLGLSREHWGIENGLHDSREETFREDRCRVRRGNAPRVLASLRNVAVYLLRTTDHPSLPAATREMVARPELAIDMIKSPPSTSE